MTSFTKRVIKLVRQIPVGKVATYGQIAALAGSPRGALAVGQILHYQLRVNEFPWHRVINARGYISTTCLEHPPELQVILLKHEGVRIVPSRGMLMIDLSKYQWRTDTLDDRWSICEYNR